MTSHLFLGSYMSGKNRHLKHIVIVIVLLLVLVSSKLYRENSLDSSTISSPPTKTIILPIPSKNISAKTVIAPVLKKTKQANNVIVNTQMLGKLPLKQVFKCDTTVDESLVEQVRQTIELYSYEMPLNIKTHQINELLAIRVISPELPIDFNQTINEKIKLILLLYEEWFGLALKEQMTMNLVLLPSLESYSDVIATLSIDSPNSQGLFWANSNFAFAAYRTEQQLEQTIIHELVHALNFYLMGYSSRWLTEGLAEYFKNIEFHMEEKRYVYSFNFDRSIDNSPPLAIADLVFLENQWDSPQRSHLYASAFELVSYLIKHKKENNILRRLLHKEARQPCTKLESATYFNLISENLVDLSADFQM